MELKDFYEDKEKRDVKTRIQESKFLKEDMKNDLLSVLNETNEKNEQKDLNEAVSLSDLEKNFATAVMNDYQNEGIVFAFENIHNVVSSAYRMADKQNEDNLKQALDKLKQMLDQLIEEVHKMR